MPNSYKDAGVDLDSYAESMSRIPSLLERTHTPGVMPLSGGFAGLYRLFCEGRTCRDPVLVSGADGVGTKIKVACEAGRFDTIGIDLVAMCVNDCLCLGAEPLFFLDYLAFPKDDPDLVADLVKGVSNGCLEAGAALLGGETAIMPGLYREGDFDMAGFCVGVVEKDEIIDGTSIEEGDILIGLSSDGLHSNGFSLARKAVFEVGGLHIDDEVDELGATVGETLLTPTKIYAKILSTLLSHDQIKSQVTGISHITGGGLAENVGRIIPEGLQARIDRTSWDVPVVFDWIERLGQIEPEEMFRVFNMGIGLVMLVRSNAVDETMTAIHENGDQATVLGHVASGPTSACYVD